MKKFISVSLALLMFSNIAFAYGNVDYEEFTQYKSKYRILYGLILIVGGGLLAYDGFRTVKTDISKPGVSMNFSGWWDQGVTQPLYFTLHSNGNITNTGNVDLRNVQVHVGYYDTAGHLQSSVHGTNIVYDSTGEKTINISMGQTKTWSNTDKYPTASTNHPYGVGQTTWSARVDYPGVYPSAQPATLVEVVSIGYDYTKKYKEEMNNPYEGVLGVLLFAGGAYLLIDYIVSLNRFEYYMKKHSMDVYVTNTSDEFKFNLSKRL